MDRSPPVPQPPLWNVPDLPPNFLPRPDDLEALKDKVLAVQQSVVMTGHSAGVSVQGMGGIGKSVLAAAIAHTSETRAAFPDGIFWLTIGQEAKLLELQTTLARAVGLQPDFSTVQQGKTDLKQYLADKACLLILDDIWNIADLAVLDVVGSRGQLLVTTRDARIGISIGATEHRLDVLSREQSRQLLAQWTQLEETALPEEADAIAQECGYLPLALAMTGAMLRGKGGDRWGNVLHRLRSADLDKIRQQFPDYPYPDLLRAIAVSVEALEPEQRQRYLDFAVFPEDTPIPETVLQTFWESEGLDEYDTQDIIDALADLSLLQRDEAGQVTLHDLQQDYVRKQTGTDVTYLHQRLLDAYSQKCTKGWSTLLNDGYSLAWIPWHLQESGRNRELRALLLDFPWLQVKLNATTINALLSDYTLLPRDRTLQLVQNTLRLSAHVVTKDKKQLAGRVLGHLLEQPEPDIQQLLAKAQDQQSDPWLRPLRRNLAPPDGALLQTLEGHSDGVLSVAASTDFSRAISASADRTLKLWDLHTGKILKTLEGHSGSVFSVAVSADFGQAISASADCTLKVWDLHTGEMLHTLEGHSDSVFSVAVSADFRRAISASADCTLKVWDLHTRNSLQTLEGNSGSVFSVTVSADFSRAISASADSNLRVWDLRTGALLQILEGHSAWVRSVAVSADFSYVISASYDGTLRVWDLHAGNTFQTLKGRSGSVWAVTVSADSSHSISSSDDGTLKLWDLHTGSLLQTLEGHSTWVWAIAASADFSRAISASNDGTLKVWDLHIGSTMQTVEGHSDRVLCVAVAANSSYAISTSDDSTLKMWDLYTGNLLRTLEGDGDSILSVGISTDSNRAVTASSNSNLIWDLQAGAILQTLGVYSGSISVAVSADFSRAISASDNGTLKVWDLYTGTSLQTLSGHGRRVSSVGMSTDSSRAISASADGTLKVWNLNTGALLLILEGHSAGVLSVSMSADFSRAISASDDHTLKVWDLQSGEEIQTLTGHNDSVLSVAVSADFSRAVSASDDRTLKVWDLHAGQVVASFMGDRPFTACAITPDGTHVVAGDSSGGVHFFKIEEP